MRRLVSSAAVAAVAAQLWGLYRVSGPPTTPWFPDVDKIEHALGFALPVVLILLARHVTGRSITRTTIVVVAAVFFAHAVISELIQGHFYRYRSGDPRDVVADTLGIALGVAAFRVVERRMPARAVR